MDRRRYSSLRFAVIGIIAVGALVVFPALLRGIEMAARQLRLMWGVILLIAIVIWVLAALRPKR
jgi:hypothetical protein